jgi:hypothetical protein
MKRLLPIVLLIIACVAFNSSCKKEGNNNPNPPPPEDFIIPDYIVAGMTKDSAYMSFQTTNELSYEFEIALVEAKKIKMNYNYNTWFGGGQSQVIIKLIPPTNIEYAAVNGQSLVKRILPGDTISSQLNWKVFENNDAAVLLDRLSGPLGNHIIGEWNYNEGFIGIRMLKNDRYYYGWVRLNIAGGPPDTAMQLLGWSIYHD